MSIRFPMLVGTRSRFQRVRDARLLHGWVYDMSMTRLVLTCPGADNLDPGDEVFAELFGKEVSLHLVAVLRERAGEHCVFELVAAHPEKAREPVRLSVPDYPVRVLVADTTQLGTLMDVGLQGAAILLASRLARGTEVGLDFQLPQGNVACEGTVSYARRWSDLRETYRTGTTLAFSDRVAAARWKTLFEGVA